VLRLILSSIGLSSYLASIISAEKCQNGQNASKTTSGEPTISHPNRIGNYEYVSLLGEGGMGAVYKYRNPAIDKFVAIKMLSITKFSETAHMRFLKEGTAASRLRHKNLLTVHDLGLTSDHQPYMVMDYFEGPTLADLIKQGVQLSNLQIREIFAQCCEGMYYAHENSVLHRDLKPSNIMVTGLKSLSPHAVIFDFGISKMLDDPGTGVTQAGEVFGSPLYMSPEQCDGRSLDVRSDIYSLGCTFYEVLTGAPPFMGDSIFSIFNAHKTQVPLPLKEASLGKVYPPEFGAVVSRMLEKNPQDRPQSMMEVKAILDGAESKPSQTSSRVHKSNTPYVVLGTVLLAGIVAFAVYLYASTASVVPAPQPQFPEYRAPAASEPPRKAEVHDHATDLGFFHAQISNQPETVDGNGTYIRDDDLKDLYQDPRLIELKIKHCAITDAGFATIAKIKGLVRLHADRTKITKVGVQHISGLSKLRFLALSENEIGDESLPYIAKLSNLRELTLNGTKITDDGLRKLAPLKNLQRLQINRTGVSDIGVKYICETFPDLYELHARQNEHVTEKSLEYIQKAPHLDRITLNQSNIKPKVLRNFFVTHPKFSNVSDEGERMMSKFIDVTPKF